MCGIFKNCVRMIVYINKNQAGVYTTDSPRTIRKSFEKLQQNYETHLSFLNENYSNDILIITILTPLVLVTLIGQFKRDSFCQG